MKTIGSMTTGASRVGVRQRRRHRAASGSGKAPRSKSLVAGVVAILFVSLALLDPGVGRGQPPAAVPRKAASILESVPYDRITLIDDSVVLTEPVSPRPLPPYDPKKAAARKPKKNEPPPREGNIGLPGEKSTFQMPERESDDDPLARVTIHLLEGDIRDFTVERVNIKAIDYFEDMLLAEADRLTLASDFTRAFECLLRVRSRNPNWGGLDEYANRLLFAEGSRALSDGDFDRGLRLLRELFDRRPDFPGLADRLAASFGGRATRAFELGLFALGRKILHDVDRLAPDHSQIRAARKRFEDRARELHESALRKEGAARLDDLAAALRVWPAREGVESAYREAFNAWPTLDVAVLDLPRGLGPWIRSPADERLTRLLFQPILANDDEESEKGQSAGQLASALRASDLGRQLVVELRGDAAWSDGSRNVASVDVARSLADAVEPSSPAFRARWADLLERVETPDERRVEIRLTRPLPKPAAWFLGPVGPAHASSDGQVVVAGGGRQLVGDGPYRVFAVDPNVLEFVAAPGTSEIRRIRETRHASNKAAIAALRRGEVALVDRVAPEQVPALLGDPELKVGRYARPSMHRIALDGRVFALRNRNLRRAISHAIDRRAILEETVLRRPSDASNLVADGVFPRGGNADAPDVKPLPTEPVLAKMLVAAARKELGRPIELTFEYPSTPVARAAAPRIADALRAAGLSIQLVERSESELETALRSGRRFDLAYRETRAGEPLVDAGPLITPCYDAPPSTDPLASVASPRILQLLLELERATEWTTARGTLVQLDRECRDELPVIPLWQIQDHYAWRSRLRGPAEEAEHLYQGIQTWEIDPWFARDAW